MTDQTSPVADVYQEVRGQFIHNNRTGRRIIGVDGVLLQDTSVFADRLAQVLAAEGMQVVRASTTSDVDAQTLKDSVLAPFRAGADDAVMILDGPFLQRPDVRGMLKFVVWVGSSDEALAARPGRSTDQPLTDEEFRYQREVRPLPAANVLVDFSDPDRPTEFYRDFC